MSQFWGLDDAAHRQGRRRGRGVPGLYPGPRGIRRRYPEGAGNPRLRVGHPDRECARLHQGRDQPARHHRADHRPAHQVPPAQRQLRPVHGRDHRRPERAHHRHRGGRRLRRAYARRRADQAHAAFLRRAGDRLYPRPGLGRAAHADPGRYREAAQYRGTGRTGSGVLILQLRPPPSGTRHPRAGPNPPALRPHGPMRRAAGKQYRLRCETTNPLRSASIRCLRPTT
ncbi:hypothetical protein CBM2589_A10082 [Cupriavidus taiwanensis]|uniref:Uncharacterized protein n=1 Tax=Cupriavidus taiwanensis TaxID=164546 RepID=A0A976A3T8_9BURK|nr:hypothetical protein CBM2589_A10082 [Cupriavidus taiwanensis]